LFADPFVAVARGTPYGLLDDCGGAVVIELVRRDV
jgi:hypothetical protein